MNKPMNQSATKSSSSRPLAQKSHANFIEALKSIGGQTAKSFAGDVVGGVSKDFIQTITGNSGASPRNYESNQEIEDRLREENQRLERHREVVETKVFDRKELETKTKIRVIQEELQLLVKELAGMDQQLETAIEEEIANPGTYHLNFFEKLRRFLLDLRKRVADSANWLEISNQRKAAQQGFWGNVGKSGTKYLLSQERTVATQSG